VLAIGLCRWQYSASVFIYLGSKALPSRIWVVGVLAQQVIRVRIHIGIRLVSSQGSIVQGLLVYRHISTGTC